MSVPTSTCPACRRIDAASSHGWDADPLFIAELRESVVMLHDHQCLRGWCVCVMKDHVEHLSTLPFARQAALFEDVARVAAAVRDTCEPRRINYECLGNVMAHVHWHVVPRYESPIDPDPRRVVWVQPTKFLECGAARVDTTTLIAKIRLAINRLA